MSYGQNQAWGLMAVKTTNGSTWNGQTSPYFIQSKYPLNIFKGDLVFLGNDGYIHNLAEYGNGTGGGQLGVKQSIGVFNGCSFQTSVALNPIDPASPGRSYWPGGTVTFNNIDATCDIIDDPSVIFNIQSDSFGVPIDAQGATAAVNYTYILPAGTNPDGNTNTGTSLVKLDTTTIGANNYNLKILRFVPVSGNVPLPGNGGNRVPYNNVEVIIQNHTFASRPTPY